MEDITVACEQITIPRWIEARTNNGVDTGCFLFACDSVERNRRSDFLHLADGDLDLRTALELARMTRAGVSRNSGSVFFSPSRWS